MESRLTSCESRDILKIPWSAFAALGLPVITIIVLGGPNLGTVWRTVVWTAALGVMGIACTVHALRCGRVHCYLTGRFFLVMAIVALLYGVDVVWLGRRGWNLIGLIALIGAFVLCCLPEMLLGKYLKGRAGG
jgi:hypothetical protein